MCGEARSSSPLAIVMNQSASSLLILSDSGNDAENEASDCVWKGVLRGLLWRLRLGALPSSSSPSSSSSSSIEQLRRAAAAARRRYADIRRRLLIDPHAVEDPHKPHPSKVDNPLSQDPESVWSRYFQIAELEETIDTDLTRLYPEHGQFFQSPVCQAMLRRILLVWSLMNPTYSYRQGMHELLAPLLYVLYCDVMHFHEVKQRYEDFFDDRFEEPFYVELKACENDGKPKMRGQKLPYSKTVTTIEGSEIHVDVGLLERITLHDLNSDELSCALRIMVLGNDTYGAEGELGVLLSGRFVEHDAYSLFDALMCGNSGVNMADYFLANSVATSPNGLSSALEISSLLYKALAAFDLPLYNHLKGLGVEPQFFALRWIRVLFGREFDLKKLLILWDAIFSVSKDSDGRRDFILALSVAMVLYLRWIMLATSNATDCLRKLLNFPENVAIEMLIETAQILAPFIGEVAHGKPHAYSHETVLNGKKKTQTTSSSPSSFSPSPNKFSPDVLRKAFPESYWEEKWRNFVLQKLNAVHVEQKNADLSGIIFFEDSKPKTSPCTCYSTKVGSKQKDENHARSIKLDEAIFLYKGNQSDYKNTTCAVLHLKEEKDDEKTGKHEQFMNGSNAYDTVFASSVERKAAIMSPVKVMTSCSPTIETDAGYHTPCQYCNDRKRVEAASREAKSSSNQKKNWIWSFSKGRKEGSKRLDEMDSSHLKKPITANRTVNELSIKAPIDIESSLDENVSRICQKQYGESLDEIGSMHVKDMTPCDEVNCADKTESSVDEDASTARLVLESLASSVTSETACNRTDARMLGKSICENVQVIEDVLLALALNSEGSEGPRVQPYESSCVPIIIDSSGQKQQAVQTAIAELRKISDSLLRM